MSQQKFSKNFLISDETASFWVSASAGSGKTQLLTKRVLSLLVQGIPATKILCITYTKAAAAEMLTRISNTLSSWVAMEDKELNKSLEGILERLPAKQEIDYAKTLFARIIDENFTSLRIQTIHALCQSILSKFPLEAGTEPYLKVIDEREQNELRNEALSKILENVKNSKNESLKQAISNISKNIHDGGIKDLIDDIFLSRGKFERIIEQNNLTEFYEKTAKYLGVDKNSNLKNETEKFISDEVNFAELRSIIQNLEQPNVLQKWLSSNVQDRQKVLTGYIEFFLTKEGASRQKLCSSKIEKKFPGTEKILQKEQERVFKFNEKTKCIKTAELTKQLFVFAAEVLSIYAKLKTRHSYIDYDDLIIKTTKLLETPGISDWIMFKLDEGIDHILLDEAQDTSPEQWRIVSALCSEFFSGEGVKSSKKRTLFIVGDEKQSIFSFQGADSDCFSMMRDNFRKIAKNSEKKWEDLYLEKSFRSSNEVLKLVDAVFSGSEFEKNVSSEYKKHILHRKDAIGRAEIWPLIEKEKTEIEETSGWKIPTGRKKFSDAAGIQAEIIAKKIKEWLDSGRVLEKTGKRITAGDVMILVRKRGHFVYYMQRALKKFGVNVAGADRLYLTEHIAVLDLISLGNFVLLPEDDYNLACLLKSPIFSFDEDEIFELSYDRGNFSIFSQLKNKSENNKKYKEAFEYLSGLLSSADFETPFEFFSKVLERDGAKEKFIKRLGKQVKEPLNEFLSLAFEFQKKHLPLMQNFIFWLTRNEAEIKNDMENKADEVKIMTVHGAKGLEAPVVFLVDQVSKEPAGKKILFDEDSEIFLWPAYSENYPVKFKALKETEKQKAYMEYSRLLYVALTRASDEIYITAFRPGSDNTKPDGRWHHIAKNAFSSYALKQGEIYFSGKEYQYSETKSDNNEEVKNDIPKFYYEKIKEQKDKKKIIRPSLVENENREKTKKLFISPSEKGFERGRIIHKILEFSSNIEAEKREERIKKFINKYANSFLESEKEKMQKEVLNILENEKFASLFSVKSRAEVSITGILDGKTISGQVDRLYIDEQKILISDYKTNVNVPENLDEIPKEYIRQLALYKKLLMSMDNSKKISCALVWTAKPEIMEVPNQVLDNHIIS